MPHCTQEQKYGKIGLGRGGEFKLVGFRIEEDSDKQNEEDILNAMDGIRTADGKIIYASDLHCLEVLT